MGGCCQRNNFPMASRMHVGCRFDIDDAGDISKRESAQGEDTISKEISNVVVFYVSLLFEE